MHVYSSDTIRPALIRREFVLGSFLIRFSILPYEDPTRNFPQTHLKNRLASLRTERGLTTHELATALHLSLPTLQALEASTYVPTLALALRVSGYFALPVEDIFLLS